MSNGIPSFNAGYGRVQGYGAVAQPQEVRPRPEIQQAAPTRATAQASASTPANGLSQAEQQMIDRYFPPSPALTLHLYGPNRGAQQVNPNAVGGRLDLRG